MEGHPNTGVIDDVILLFHSDYHAIFIDSSNRQYLTVCRMVLQEGAKLYMKHII